MITQPIARTVVVSAQTLGILLTRMALCVVLPSAALVSVWTRESIHPLVQPLVISMSKFLRADVEAPAIFHLQVVVHRIHANDEKIL
jgi:hypothetical protein